MQSNWNYRNVIQRNNASLHYTSLDTRTYAFQQKIKQIFIFLVKKPRKHKKLENFHYLAHPARLVVEQSQVGVHKSYTITVARLDHGSVVDRSGGTRNVLDATLKCDLRWKRLRSRRTSQTHRDRAIYVVAEREEGVRSQRHVAHLVQPILALDFCELIRHFLVHGGPKQSVHAFPYTQHNNAVKMWL